MTRERKRDESETTHQIRVYADQVRERFPAGMAWQFLSNHAPYIAEHLERFGVIVKYTNDDLEAAMLALDDAGIPTAVNDRVNEQRIKCIAKHFAKVRNRDDTEPN